ncbi:sensor histidine kinase [Williamsia muralis]|nr:sensor histidine kinase [Williamsia muralis]
MINTVGALPPSRTWWREGAVAMTAFAISLLGGVFQVDDTLSPPPAAAYVIALVSCAVLPLRHRTPLAAMAATTVAGMLVAPLDLLLTPLIAVPAVIAAYSVAVRGERAPTAAVLLTSSVLMIAPTPLCGSLSWQDASRLASVVAFVLMSGVLGYSTQIRRAYLAAVEERAQRAEETRDSEARQRVAEERLRIARELHDVVAHQITLANAQATVAAHLFDARPEQSRTSVTELVQTTRDALDGLRATVGLLRQSGDASTPTEPAPGLSRLSALLESFRRAGLEATVYHKGTVKPLPPGVDLTAYRIVQEALTNVTKHADTDTAQVQLDWGRDHVTITVADDGRSDGGGIRGATTEEAGPAGSSPPKRTPGYGLIGMRERVTAVGGQLTAGRRTKGGFLVAATLPFPSANATTTKRKETTIRGQVVDRAVSDERPGDRSAGTS